MNNSQEVMKTIKMIAKEQGKPLGKMLEDCGLSKNALSSMSSGYLPRTENLVKIADYLDISVDYLLGRTIKNNAPDSIRDVIITKMIALYCIKIKKFPLRGLNLRGDYSCHIDLIFLSKQHVPV